MTTAIVEIGLQVGETPLIELKRLAESLPGVRLLAKAEWHNPGGSVKDRPALWMLREGLASGKLAPGKAILDATSGNTGIAYAWMGARLGFEVVLAVPKSIAPSRRRVLEALGARLQLTDPLEGSDGAIRAARKIFEQDPGRWFYPDQYNNPANWRAHYETTAPEIWRQTGGRLTHFVAGLGTTGTFVGAGRRLRELDPSIELVSVQPEEPLHGLEGLKHLETAIVPGIYDPKLANAELFIPTEEAYAAARRAAREEGLLIGPSGGANLAACLRLAADFSRQRIDATLVTVFPDSGERYLDESAIFSRRPG